MWVISVSCWVTGVNNLKKYSNPEEWRFDIVPECKNPTSPCYVRSYGSFIGLNVSLVSHMETDIHVSINIYDLHNYIPLTGHSTNSASYLDLQIKYDNQGKLHCVI